MKAIALSIALMSASMPVMALEEATFETLGLVAFFTMSAGPIVASQVEHEQFTSKIDCHKRAAQYSELVSKTYKNTRFAKFKQDTGATTLVMNATLPNGNKATLICYKDHSFKSLLTIKQESTTEVPTPNWKQ